MVQVFTGFRAPCWQAGNATKIGRMPEFENALPAKCTATAAFIVRRCGRWNGSSRKWTRGSAHRLASCARNSRGNPDSFHACCPPFWDRCSCGRRGGKKNSSRMEGPTNRQAFWNAEIGLRQELRSSVPVLSGLAGREQVKDFPQTLADVLDFRIRLGRKWNGSLRFVRLGFSAQLLTCARYGESLLVQQLLDAQDILHITLAIHALACAALDGLQLREFRLPESQHVRGQAA